MEGLGLASLSSHNPALLKKNIPFIRFTSVRRSVPFRLYQIIAISILVCTTLHVKTIITNSTKERERERERERVSERKKRKKHEKTNNTTTTHISFIYLDIYNTVCIYK